MSKIFTFGDRSQANLATAHADVRAACFKGLSWGIYDFAVIWGFRGQRDQDQAFMTGVSTKQWPNSKHNVMVNDKPMSDAIDFVPWCRLPNGKMGIPWKDTHAFAVVGGIILAAGAEIGVELRYGGDWDMDGTTTDQLLMDWGHVERVT